MTDTIEKSDPDWAVLIDFELDEDPICDFGEYCNGEGKVEWLCITSCCGQKYYVCTICRQEILIVISIDRPGTHVTCHVCNAMVPIEKFYSRIIPI